MKERRKRVREVLDWLKAYQHYKSYRSIAKEMGYNPSMLSQVITGKASVSSKLVLSLCSLNPDLKYDWIWTGNGNMLKSKDSNEDLQQVSDNMLDRFTIILDNMAQMMNNMSMLVGPLIKDVNNLKSIIDNQNSEIKRLRQEIKKIKTAIP